MLFAEEKYREAAERFRHSLQSYVSHYNSKTGPKNLEAIGSSQIVSYVLMKSEQFDEAIKTLTMELDKAKEVYGSESIQAAETMTNLATVHFYKNDFDKAEECYKKALQCFYPSSTSDRAEYPVGDSLIVVLSGLGDIHYIQGRYERARKYYLKVEDHFYEDDSADRISLYLPAIKNLAMTHWHLGDLDKALAGLQFLRHLLDRDPKYGEDHPHKLRVEGLIGELQSM